MEIIAIKDMSMGNAEVGEMWQETKIFDANDSLLDVMKWVEITTKKVTLSIPENSQQEFWKITGKISGNPF